MSISTNAPAPVQSAQLVKAGERPPHPGPYALKDPKGRLTGRYEITKEPSHHLPPTTETGCEWIPMTGPADGVLLARLHNLVISHKSADVNVARLNEWIQLGIRRCCLGRLVSMLDRPVRLEQGGYGIVDRYMAARLITELEREITKLDMEIEQSRRHLLRS